MHSPGIAICPFEVEDLRAEVARLMAPFNKEIEVPEYAVRRPESHARQMMEMRRCATMEELRVKLKYDFHFFVEDGELFMLTTSNPQGHWAAGVDHSGTDAVGHYNT